MLAWYFAISHAKNEINSYSNFYLWPVGGIFGFGFLFFVFLRGGSRAGFYLPGIFFLLKKKKWTEFVNVS